mgnify:CR=1 FL=1
MVTTMMSVLVAYTGLKQLQTAALATAIHDGALSGDFQLVAEEVAVWTVGCYARRQHSQASTVEPDNILCASCNGPMSHTASRARYSYVDVRVGAACKHA